MNAKQKKILLQIIALITAAIAGIHVNDLANDKPAESSPCAEVATK